jgi:hypothetical protein|nr:MAG TPA: hypothetical protein [Caudoviricetes sp.]
MDITISKAIENNLVSLLKKVKHHTILFHEPFTTNNIKDYYPKNNYCIVSVTMIREVLRVNAIVYRKEGEKSTFSIELDRFSLDDIFHILQLSIESL